METRVNPYNNKYIDIKCANFEVCDAWMGVECLSLKSGVLCTNCDILFSDWKNGNYGKGVLNFKNNIECPICIETKKCVKYLNCDHYICVDDFKRCFYGDKDLKNEPPFPYPELEDDYYKKNQDHPYYENDPVIIKYHEKWNEWCVSVDQKHDSETYLRQCCICRI